LDAKAWRDKDLEKLIHEQIRTKKEAMRSTAVMKSSQ
jgi:hypothetical protein